MEYSMSLMTMIICICCWLISNGRGSQVTAADMKRLLSKKSALTTEKKQKLLSSSAEGLLIKGGIPTWKPPTFSLTREKEPNCYLRKTFSIKLTTSAIKHDFLFQKGIKIPKEKGIYEENPVTFLFNSEEVKMVPMLKCSCQMASADKDYGNDSSTESYESLEYMESANQIKESRTTDHTTNIEEYHTPPSNDDETGGSNFISRFKNGQFTKSTSRRELEDGIPYQSGIVQDHKQQISPERGEIKSSNVEKPNIVVDTHSQTPEENKNSSSAEENDAKPSPTSPKSLRVRIKESFNRGLERVFSWRKGSQKSESHNSSPTKNEIETEPYQMSTSDVERKEFPEYSKISEVQTSEDEMARVIVKKNNVKHSFSQVHKNPEQLKATSTASGESTSRQDQSVNNDKYENDVSINYKVDHKPSVEYKTLSIGNRNRSSSGMEEKEILNAPEFEVAEQKKDRNTSTSSKNDNKQTIMESTKSDGLDKSEGSSQNANGTATQGFMGSLIGSLMGMLGRSTKTEDKKSISQTEIEKIEKVDHTLSEKYEPLNKNSMNESGPDGKEILETSEPSILVRKENDNDHSSSKKVIQIDQTYKNNSSIEEQNNSKQETKGSIAEDRKYADQKTEEGSSTASTVDQGIVGSLFGGLVHRFSSKTKIEEDNSGSTMKSIPQKNASAEEQNISEDRSASADRVLKVNMIDSQKTEKGFQMPQSSSQMSPSNDDGTIQTEELNFITRFRNEQYAKSQSKRELDEGVPYQSGIVPGHGQQISPERGEEKSSNIENPTTVPPTQGVIGGVFGSLAGLMGRFSGKEKLEDKKSASSSSSQENDEYEYGKIIIVPVRRNEEVLLNNRNVMGEEEIVSQKTEGTEQTIMDAPIIYEKEVLGSISKISEIISEHSVSESQEQSSEELQKIRKREEIMVIPQTSHHEINKSADIESLHSQNSTTFVEGHIEDIANKSLTKEDDEGKGLNRQIAGIEIITEEKQNNHVLTSKNLHPDGNQITHQVEHITKEEKYVNEDENETKKKKSTSHSSSSSSSSSSESHSGGKSEEKVRKEGKHKSKKLQSTIEPDQAEPKANNELDEGGEYRNEKYRDDYKNQVREDTVQNLIKRECKDNIDKSSADSKSEEENKKKLDKSKNEKEKTISIDMKMEETDIKEYTDNAYDENCANQTKNTSSRSEEKRRKLENNESNDKFNPKEEFEQMGQSSRHNEFLVLEEKKQEQTNLNIYPSEKISESEKEEKSNSSQSSDENNSARKKSFDTSAGKERMDSEDRVFTNEKTISLVENSESMDDKDKHEEIEVKKSAMEGTQSPTHTVNSIRETESNSVELQMHRGDDETVHHLFRRSPSPLLPTLIRKKRKKIYNFATEVPSRSICNEKEGGGRVVYLSEGLWKNKSFFVYRKTRKNQFHVIAYIIVD